ncbi:MAG: hypothetical protein ABIO71_06650 [Caldimonas sp.]
MTRPCLPSKLLLAVAGCGALSLAAHADGVPAAAAKSTKAAQATPTSQWTRAASAKANGSGVRLSYNVPLALLPGRTGSVQLQFSGVTGDDARVEWRAPEGSSVSSAVLGTATSMALPRGETTTVLLDVTPAADGMAYLDVFTTQGGRTTAQSVPLKVGTGAIRLKREGTLLTSPSGEKVISLPSTPK